MQLAITILSKKTTPFLPDVLAAISTYKCNILTLNVASLSPSATAAYLLLEGNWNYLAKLETYLDNLQKRLDVKINSLHTEAKNINETKPEAIAYSLETISIDREGMIQDVLTFLLTHHIIIAEISSQCYPSVYSQTLLLSTKFIILLPPDLQLMSFREELLNFCDNCNVDAIFEPLKR